MPARNPETATCKIKGCTRAAKTGYLCRGHQSHVPFLEGIKCSLACASASRREANRWHKRWLAEVRRKIAAGEAA